MAISKRAALRVFDIGRRDWLRAARALLDWTQPELAAKAALSLSTVVDFERDRRVVLAEAVAAIRAALESAGVEFTNGDGPGVKMKKQPYTIEHLANVVGRFKNNILSLPDWQNYEISPLNNGFEVWKNGKFFGRITVAQGEAIFDPPLLTPRERPDRWVTEEELRLWVQSLAYPR